MWERGVAGAEKVMAEYTLQAQPRQITGKKVGRLRREGVVPAVVYGPALSGPQSIQLDRKAFETLYARAGLSRLVTLTVDGGRGQPVFIRDVQYNLLRRRIDHVDFYAARMDVETTVSVPVTLVGDAPVATRGEGVVTQALTSVTLRALPRDIPPHLEIDASRIETLNDDVRIADLTLPSGVTVVDPPDTIVISVTRVSVEVEEVAEPVAAEAAEVEEASAEETPTGEAADESAGEA
jgi:large subunit ribosomal protein L25